MKMVEGLQIPHSYVLIKMLRSNDEVFIGNFKAYLNTSFEQEKNQSVYGEVVKVPDELFFLGSSDISRYSNIAMPWKCDMELQVGDKVVIDYLEAQTAMGAGHNNFTNPRYLVDYSITDKEWYCFIPYQHVLVAEREGELIPLNGNILGTPKIIDTPTGPDYHDRIVTLEHVGKPVYEYSKMGEYAKCEESRGLKPRMEVILERYNNRWLEFSLHNHFGKFYVFKSPDVEVVLEGEEVQL